MSKKLFLMCLIGLMFTSSANAKCDGGTMITAKSGTFCVSDFPLPNWWSVASWCKANGMILPTIYDLCPSWDGNTGGGKCPEVSGSGSTDVYTSTASDSENAFFVNLSNGSVSISTCGRHCDGYTICRN